MTTADQLTPEHAQRTVKGWLSLSPRLAQQHKGARLSQALVAGETVRSANRKESGSFSQVVFIMRRAGFQIATTPEGWKVETQPDLSEVEAITPRVPTTDTYRPRLKVSEPAQPEPEPVKVPALGAQLTVVMLAQDPKGGIALALQNGRQLYHCRLEAQP